MDNQFYPTSSVLSARAWSKFKNKDYVRVLEPSAGDGALLRNARLKSKGSYGKDVPVDVIEIDLAKHPSLREEGYNVIGIAQLMI